MAAQTKNRGKESSFICHQIYISISIHLQPVTYTKAPLPEHKMASQISWHIRAICQKILISQYTRLSLYVVCMELLLSIPTNITTHLEHTRPQGRSIKHKCTGWMACHNNTLLLACVLHLIMIIMVFVVSVGAVNYYFTFSHTLLYSQQQSEQDHFIPLIIIIIIISLWYLTLSCCSVGVRVGVNLGTTGDEIFAQLFSTWDGTGS